MSSIEEIQRKEEEMKKREDELKEEMLRWKTRCLMVEKTAEDMQERVKKIEEKALPEVPTEETQSLKRILGLLHQDVQSINEGFNSLGEKTTDMFQSLKGDYAVLKQELEESRQYSMLNNALLHGFKRLPDLRGAAFICSIANKLNELFPSLSGPILPIHIDDAHPLRTKKRNRTKVVIIRFANRWVKEELFNCRVDLEGTGLLLTEHLTDLSRKLLSEAASIVGKNNASVHKTRVYAKCNGIKYIIKTEKDIANLRENYNKLPPTATVEHTTPRYVSTPNRIPIHGRPSHYGRGRSMLRGGMRNY